MLVAVRVARGVVEGRVERREAELWHAIQTDEIKRVCHDVVVAIALIL